MAVKTPLKVSERSLVEEKLALLANEVYTPIRLAVVAVTSSAAPVTHRQCTGSEVPRKLNLSLPSSADQTDTLWSKELLMRF